MNKGVVLVAFGEPCYGRAAWNLALSIKHHSPDVKIFLLHDEKVFSKGNFDLSVFDERKIIESDYANPALTKAGIYEHLPFEHNLYLDVDAVCFKDINPLFNRLIESKASYAVQVLDTYGYDSEEEMPMMFWAGKSVIWEHYNLPKEAKLPATQSSVQYIRKSDEAKKIFEQLNLNLRNPIPLHKLRNQWGGSQPDELYLNIALAQLGVNPPIGDDVLFFANKIDKRALAQIQSSYYFMSIYGGRLFTRPSYKDFYDRLMVKYCYAKGINHRFKIGYVLERKHSDKKQIAFPKTKTVRVERSAPVSKRVEKAQAPERIIPQIPVNTNLHLFISWYNAKDDSREKELLNILNLNRGAKLFLVSEQEFKSNIPDGIEKIKLSSRPTYTDMFRIASSHADENTVSIIANADIEFNALCLAQLSNVNYDNTVLALSRWEKKTGRIVTMNGLTQDAWVFKGKKEIDCNTELGMPGCDHVIAWELNKHFNVRNPSLDIKIWHHDSEKTYTQADRVRGPYLSVKPTHIKEISTKAQRKERLLIIQPGHFGDILICLPIAKYYSQHYDVFWACPPRYHNLFRNINYCRAVTDSDWFKKGYEMILDLSFGLSQGEVNGWWNKNMHRFNSFVEAKYELSDIDVKERWNLEYSRNPAREKALFRQLGLEGEKYALVHEETYSNKNVKANFTTSLQKVHFKPLRDYNVFDWYEVIVNASEIHCIDSALANFVEVLKEAKAITKTIVPGSNGTGVMMSLYKNNWKTSRIAAHVEANGMTIGESFKAGIKKAIAENRPSFILETGTYLGNGSTKVILDALQENSLDAKVVSIECNEDFIKQAEKNLALHPKKSQLQILQGLSIPSELLPKEVSYTDVPDAVIVDHENPNEYLKEVIFDKDNLIASAIAMHGSPDMVILDSAGHIGTIEFKYLMSLIKDSFILAIDDTRHLKHYKTLELIKADKNFEVLSEGAEKFGYAICKYTVKKKVKKSIEV